jgi:glutamine kinase
MLKTLQRFKFGSKAETLARLQGQLTHSSVPEFECFSWAEWKTDPEDILQRIEASFPEGCAIIVRSSAFNEDGEIYAQAGIFLSVPHVDPTDREAVREAVDNVFRSYESDAKRGNLDDDQIIVQRMIRDVSMSGVVFTQALSSGAPYYVVNYDDETGSTDSVTSGTGYANRTIYIFRDSWAEFRSPRFSSLISTVQEIERLTGDVCLDIEFALDDALNVYIFQVRRLTTQPNWSRGLGLRIADAIERLRSTVSHRLLQAEPPPKDGTIFGKMPDWNPAEIIGNAPRQLSFSLYRYLITDNSWRRARALMGYYEPRGYPLMISCAGQPYIDVRQSFRSFLPACLSRDLAEHIVDHWLQQLAEKPHLHDKVEFEVALTAWSFDFEKRAERLLPPDLSANERAEVGDAFRSLTFELLGESSASLSRQVALVEQLEARYNALASDPERHPRVELVAELLEDTIHFGTVPFSILARHAFIARLLMLSLVEEQVLTMHDVDRFYRSIKTVAGNFIEDSRLLAAGQINEEEFFERYGHLRPGTYDILSLRYDQRGSAVLGNAESQSDAALSGEKDRFELSPSQEAVIADRMQREGLSISPYDLLDYCARGTQAREWAKFIFTRSVSDSIELIAAWGRDQGLSRDELSHLDIRDILDCGIGIRRRSIEEHLRELSQQAQYDHEITVGIQLPHLLVRPSDLFIVPMLLEQPNFITHKKAAGPCCYVGGGEIAPDNLDHHIVAIESADPGFDWIFARKILGLVTKFGGANSHMAIRCAEFGIPAAIGCGEQIFDRIVRSRNVELDSAVGTIRPIDQ